MTIFGQMLSRHLTLEVIMSDITDVQNSLNINFTGIHVFDYLFSVKPGIDVHPITDETLSDATVIEISSWSHF